MRKLIVILLMISATYILSSKPNIEVYKVYSKTFIMDTAGKATTTDSVSGTSEPFSLVCDTLAFIAQVEGGLYNPVTERIFGQVGASPMNDSVYLQVKLQNLTPDGKYDPLPVFTTTGTHAWTTVITKPLNDSVKKVVFGTPIANSSAQTGRIHFQMSNEHPNHAQKITLTIWAIRKWRDD